MTELITWFRAQLDTAERDAYDVHSIDCAIHHSYPDSRIDCDCGWPDRLVRQVQAHRAILEQHQPEEGWAHGPGTKMDRGQVCGTCARADRFEELVGAAFPCVTLRLLVSICSDRDGYKEEWSA